MTTYQRLKKENQELKLELLKLSCDPDSHESFMIKKKYKTIREFEKAIWYSNIKENQNNFLGILNKIS
jgi:hypothetical protein